MKKLLLIFAAMLATVGVKADVVDVLTQEVTGVTGTTYTDFADKTASSDAVYAGQCAGDKGSIQLRSKNNNSGVITTTSGGTVKKIVVEWHDDTAEGRTLNVYGSNSPYAAATDLYADATSGELLGTIVKGTSTELEITGNYAYVGFRSANSAMYLTSVSITWGTAGTGEEKPGKPTISGVAEFTESTEVTITAAEGCKIYYSYDESEFVDLSQCSEYTAPFTLTSTTTVYAQAVDAQGKKSDIASKTFTKLNLPEVNNIAEIALYDDGTKILLNFTMTAVCQNGNNLVVRDGYNSILVYGNTGQTYKNGENVPMGAIAEVSSYGGNKQLKPVQFGAALPGAPIEPTTVTATTLAEQGYLAYVKMENVNLAINNKNITITDAEGNEVAGYNQFGLNLSTLDTEAKYDIVGVYGSYNGNKQLQPTEIISKAPAYEPTGDGTMANPYTVKDVKHLCATTDGPQDKVWVKGTIAGNVNTNTGELQVPEDVETAVASNIMLQTGDDMISVQLLAGDVRAALNIKDNLENIGKEVWVYGTIKELYCKIAGVKNVTEYSWDGTTTAIRTINADSQHDGKFLQNGKIVIVKNGKTYTTSGRLKIKD